MGRGRRELETTTIYYLLIAGDVTRSGLPDPDTPIAVGARVASAATSIEARIRVSAEMRAGIGGLIDSRSGGLPLEMPNEAPITDTKGKAIES